MIKQWLCTTETPWNTMTCFIRSSILSPDRRHAWSQEEEIELLYKKKEQAFELWYHNQTDQNLGSLVAPPVCSRHASTRQ